MLNGAEGLTRRTVEPDTPVRLRLVNTHSTPLRLVLDGTPFRVVAIDGTDLNRPEPLENRTLELAGGSRYDLAFTMPSTPVQLAVEDGTAASCQPERPRRAAALEAEATFDPLDYGEPAATAIGPSTDFDREFVFEIGRKPGSLDGRPGLHWSINGDTPDVPVFVVGRRLRQGDDPQRHEVRASDAPARPPHAGAEPKRCAGVRQPWWSDTLNLRKGERFEIAFQADNTGLWMDHCHNLRHAAEGLTMHVAYEGVTTPFTVGGAAHNHPE